MSYQKIDLSATANDGQGDDARTGGAKINTNFVELFSRSFKLGDTIVSRFDFDPLVPAFDAYKVDDQVKGWVDVQKTHFVEGFVLQLGFVFPTDIDDTTKFFKLTEKININ